MHATEETFARTAQQAPSGKPCPWLVTICPLVDNMLSILGTACHVCRSSRVRRLTGERQGLPDLVCQGGELPEVVRGEVRLHVRPLLLLTSISVSATSGRPMVGRRVLWSMRVMRCIHISPMMCGVASQGRVTPPTPAPRYPQTTAVWAARGLPMPPCFAPLVARQTYAPG
jgi:hypothetical protein